VLREDKDKTFVIHLITRWRCFGPDVVSQRLKQP
jgi:hypothetical protein